MISAKILQVTCSSLGEIHFINTGFFKDWGFQPFLFPFFPASQLNPGGWRFQHPEGNGRIRPETNFKPSSCEEIRGCSQHLVNLVPRNWLEPWKQHETTRYKYCWGRLDLHHNEPRVFSKCCSFVLLALGNPWSNWRGPSWQVFGGYLQVYNDYRCPIEFR